MPLPPISFRSGPAAFAGGSGAFIVRAIHEYLGAGVNPGSAVVGAAGALSRAIPTLTFAQSLQASSLAYQSIQSLQQSVANKPASALPPSAHASTSGVSNRFQYLVMATATDPSTGDQRQTPLWIQSQNRLSPNEILSTAGEMFANSPFTPQASGRSYQAIQAGQPGGIEEVSAAGPVDFQISQAIKVIQR